MEKLFVSWPGGVGTPSEIPTGGARKTARKGKATRKTRKGRKSSKKTRSGARKH